MNNSFSTNQQNPTQPKESTVNNSSSTNQQNPTQPKESTVNNSNPQTPHAFNHQGGFPSYEGMFNMQQSQFAPPPSMAQMGLGMSPYLPQWGGAHIGSPMPGMSPMRPMHPPVNMSTIFGGPYGQVAQPVGQAPLGARGEVAVALAVSTFEIGKTVLFVEGHGLTCFEGKDIPGVCKVLATIGKMYHSNGSQVDVFVCSVPGFVRAIVLSPMSNPSHPTSWTQMLDYIQLIAPTVSMVQLKRFVWSEVPALAKILNYAPETKAADLVEEYFKEQQNLAVRNQKD